MTITIQKPTDHLYHRYPQQTQPQGTYIELDPESRTARADWDGEIGGAVPFSVWHRTTLRYTLPSVYLTADGIGAIMDEMAPLMERVCDGHTVEWDGSNHVGRMTDDASETNEEIQNTLMDRRVDSDDEVEVWDAGDWFGGVESEILSRVRAGEAAEAVIKETIDEHDTGHRPLILEGLDEYIERVQRYAPSRPYDG